MYDVKIVIDPNRKEVKFDKDMETLVVGMARQQAAEIVGRYKAQRQRKAEWDGRSRRLIGARVTPDEYLRVKAAAKRSHRSLYRFTVDSLRKECEYVENPPWASIR